MKTGVWVNGNAIVIEGDVKGMIEIPQCDHFDVAVSDGSLCRFEMIGDRINIQTVVEGDKLKSSNLHGLIFRDGINWVSLVNVFLKR